MQKCWKIVDLHEGLETRGFVQHIVAGLGQFVHEAQTSTQSRQVQTLHTERVSVLGSVIRGGAASSLRHFLPLA